MHDERHADVGCTKDSAGKDVDTAPTLSTDAAVMGALCVDLQEGVLLCSAVALSLSGPAVRMSAHSETVSTAAPWREG